jgi:excisionase family DNA binding protein
MERRFLSPREAAEYLGCHLMTVYSWIDSGKIPSARLGRKILVDKRRLDAQLEAAAIAGGPGGQHEAR